MSMPSGAYSSQMSSPKEKIPHGYKKGTMQNFTPEMMQLFQSLFSNVGPGSYLSRLANGDQSMFEEMEAPAMKQFGELQGQIASRFSGGQPGQMSARGGSGFKNSMNSAANDFASQLQSQRLGLRNQALQDLMGMSNNLLQQKPYENYLVQKQQNPWGGIVNDLFGSIPGAITSAFTG